MQNLEKMTEASRDSPVVDSSRFFYRTFTENLLLAHTVDGYVLVCAVLVSKVSTHRTIPARYSREYISKTVLL